MWINVLPWREQRRHMLRQCSWHLVLSLSLVLASCYLWQQKIVIPVQRWAAWRLQQHQRIAQQQHKRRALENQHREPSPEAVSAYLLRFLPHLMALPAGPFRLQQLHIDGPRIYVRGQAPNLFGLSRNLQYLSSQHWLSQLAWFAEPSAAPLRYTFALHGRWTLPAAPHSPFSAIGVTHASLPTQPPALVA